MTTRFIKNYDEADAYINKGRDKMSRPFGHRTRIMRLPASRLGVARVNNGEMVLENELADYITVRYWNTDIVVFKKNKSGRQTFCVDAYDSVTTRKRIRDVTGLYIKQIGTLGIPVLGNSQYINGTWFRGGVSPKYIADKSTWIDCGTGEVLHAKRAEQRLKIVADEYNMRCWDWWRKHTKKQDKFVYYNNKMSQIASMTKRKHSEYVTQLAITEATRKERKELQELLLVEMGAL